MKWICAKGEPGVDLDDINRKSVTCSEILNPTARMSVFQDFMTRTVTLLNGVWSRLNYIRELKKPDGTYEHWGLSKIYGERTANDAIADIHSELYLQLLRTPLSELHEQLDLGAQDADCLPRELIDHLVQQRTSLVPRDRRGGEPAHFKSVLVINRLLNRHSKLKPKSDGSSNRVPEPKR